MIISDFYQHPAILEAFGPNRTKKVISQLREVWPDFLGEGENKLFPIGNKPLNEFYTAWLLYILANCKSYSRVDVVNAILRGKDLRCNGELFIVWFGNLLRNPDKLNEVENIFIFYDLDACVQVTPNLESENLPNLSVKIFQGKYRASHIRRSASLDREFLKEISGLISGSVGDTSPETVYGEGGKQFTNEDEAVRYYEQNPDEIELI